MSVPTLLDRALEATVVLSFTSVGHAARQRLFDWDDDLDATGRTVLVTGATSGLGLATATRLAAAGASVRFLARNADKAADVRDRIVAATGNDDVTFGIADLARLDDVRRFAADFLDEHDRLDALVHNAGALLADRIVTDDGLEFTFQTQVVAPTLLTALLRPALAAGDGRVQFVSSGGLYAEKLVADRVEMRTHGYNGTTAYARAKRAQLSLVHLWSGWLADDGITVNAMHPGWAATPGVEDSLPVFNRVMGPLLRTPEQGADTIVWLAVADEAAGATGGFFLDRRRRPEHKLPTTRMADPEQQREEARLWELVRDAAGLEPGAFGEPVQSTGSAGSASA